MNITEISSKWLAAWNNKNLSGIMSCYSDDIEHTSPKISKYYNDGKNTIKGKHLLKDYFEKALSKNPGLTFELIHILEGQSSAVLLYKRMQDHMAAEYLEFNPNGLIAISRSHYKGV